MPRDPPVTTAFLPASTASPLPGHGLVRAFEPTAGRAPRGRLRGNPSIRRPGAGAAPGHGTAPAGHGTAPAGHGAGRGGRGGGAWSRPLSAVSRQPMEAIAWTKVFDGRMTAEALAGSGW